MRVRAGWSAKTKRGGRMMSAAAAVDDATETPGSKVGITQASSAEIRNLDANSSKSNIAPAILWPTLS